MHGKKLPPQTVGTQGPAVETGQRGDRGTLQWVLLSPDRKRGGSGWFAFIFSKG